MSDPVELDVAVVGAGAAGCTAALVAAREGLTVALLEKDASEPSNTALSGGWVFAAGTRYQRAAGIEDSPEALFRDIQEKNGGESDPAVVRAICEVAPDVVHWLADGVGYELELAPESGRVDDRDAPLRGHEGVGGRGGKALLAALRARVAREDGITFADRTPGRALVRRDGGVAGVLAGDEEVLARAVVLSCDGFGASRALLEEYCPEASAMEFVGGHASTGEAIVWGRELGARLDNMDAFQGHCQFVKGYGIRLSPGIPGEGGIVVDRRGRRFAREDVNYSGFALELARLPEREAVEIFDERILAAVRDQEMMREATAAGAYKRADGVEELAALFELPLDGLRETLAEYARGHDPFGRRTLGPPLRPPLYAARVVPALAHTQGGLAVDPAMRVLGADRTPIPGLLAAGGSAAGLSGRGAWGYTSGNGLLSALGGGFIAGRTAATTPS